MIAKKFRLKEKEVKKVLQRWKPFFSYTMVLNYCKNKEKFNRFAIVVSQKKVNTNVTRNFYRRLFYDYSLKYLKPSEWTNYDCVFVLKKQVKLDKNNVESINNFKRDIGFCLKKLEAFQI